MSKEWKVEWNVQELNDRLRANSRAATVRNLAERIFIGLCHSDDVQDYDLASSWSFDAAEAFVIEAERRAEQCK